MFSTTPLVLLEMESSFHQADHNQSYQYINTFNHWIITKFVLLKRSVAFTNEVILKLKEKKNYNPQQLMHYLTRYCLPCHLQDLKPEKTYTGAEFFWNNLIILTFFSLCHYISLPKKCNTTAFPWKAGKPAATQAQRQFGSQDLCATSSVATAWAKIGHAPSVVDIVHSFIIELKKTKQFQFVEMTK